MARLALAQSLERGGRPLPAAGSGRARRRIHEARKALKRAASLRAAFAPIVGSAGLCRARRGRRGAAAVGRARDLDCCRGVLASVKCPPETRDVLMRAIAIERGKARGEHAERRRRPLRGRAAGRRRRGRRLGPGGRRHRAAAAVAAPHLSRGQASRRARPGRAATPTICTTCASRVVDLGHQCELFEPAWPAMFSAHRRRTAQTAADRSATHNDLTMLGEFALARRELPAEAAEAFVALVLRRRKPLERRAAAQFERLFAERPGRLRASGSRRIWRIRSIRRGVRAEGRLGRRRRSGHDPSRRSYGDILVDKPKPCGSVSWQARMLHGQRTERAIFPG